MALLGCEKAPSVGFEISFEQPAPTLTASNGFASGLYKIPLSNQFPMGNGILWYFVGFCGIFWYFLVFPTQKKKKYEKN
jgi:hypothetical protein